MPYCSMSSNFWQGTITPPFQGHIGRLHIKNSLGCNASGRSYALWLSAPAKVALDKIHLLKRFRRAIACRAHCCMLTYFNFRVSCIYTLQHQLKSYQEVF